MASLNRIPLDTATLREVSLRVAYRCLCRDWRARPPGDHVEPLDWVSEQVSRYQLLGFPVVALQIDQFVSAMEDGYTISFFLTSRCSAYRRGALDERRRLLPSYKANRTLTPRVTNRGCQVDVWRDPANNATLPDGLGEVRDG